MSDDHGGDPGRDPATAEAEKQAILDALLEALHAQIDAWVAAERARDLATPRAPAPAALPAGLADGGLASLGFGPNMRQRLSHAGLRSCEELAASKPDALSRALGDVVDIETIRLWIARAAGHC